MTLHGRLEMKAAFTDKKEFEKKKKRKKEFEGGVDDAIRFLFFSF